MDKKIKKRYSLMICLLAGASIILSVSMALALYFGYNESTQLTDGIWHTLIMALIVPVFGVLGVCCAYFCKGKAFIDHIGEGRTNLFSSLSYALVAVVGVVLGMSYMLASYDDPIKSLLSQSSQAPHYSNLLAVVLAFCVSAVMALLIFSKNGRYSSVRLLPLLAFSVCYGIRLHTDMSVLLMNTRRMISILAISMLIIFITGKIRVLCYKSAQKYYLISGFLTVGALCVSGFSGVMINVLGAVDDKVQFWFYAYELTLAIYVFSELFKYLVDTAKEQK